MNKECGKKQLVLRNRWFYQKNFYIMQLINLLNKNNQSTEKDIQKYLEKRRLWLAEELNLCYPKLKYFNYQVTINYKIYMKGHKYDTCKVFQ